MDKKPSSNLNGGSSVKSPSSATDPSNSGGKPPTLEPKAIWAENTPPPTHAESSVVGIAPKSGQGT